MLGAALHYLLEKNYSVIPVDRASKRPVIASWKEFYEVRRPTEQEVRDWWIKYPNANVAIVCGRLSNIFVVDVDSGGSCQGFPITYTVKTGGNGWHFYFKWEERLASLKNTVGVKFRTDLRGEGSYVIAPPSIHASGAVYTLSMDEELAPFPFDLFPNVSGPHKATGTWRDKLNGMPAGGRNAAATEIMGAMMRLTLPVQWDRIVWPFMVWWNTQNTPPMPLQELEKTYNSIADRALTRNWPGYLKK